MHQDKDSLLPQKLKRCVLLIGANLIEIQRLEMGMKYLLRFLSLHEEESDSKDLVSDRFHNKTLGGLLSEFKKKADANEGFEALLDQLLHERNILAHHLLEIPGFNLTTIEGVEIGITFLKHQRKTITHVNRIMMRVMFGCLYCIVEINGIDVAISHDDYQQLKQQILYNVEFIDETFPEKTVWENTKIVRLLNYAATACAQDDGWARLSICGQIIKSIDPGCIPQKYGCKTLSQILEISNLFDMKRVPSANAKNVHVYYKSRTLSL